MLPVGRGVLIRLLIIAKNDRERDVFASLCGYKRVEQNNEAGEQATQQSTQAAKEKDVTPLV